MHSWVFISFIHACCFGQQPGGYGPARNERLVNTTLDVWPIGKRTFAISMTVRNLHRTSAIVVVVFACLHIVNHLAALGGVASHIAFTDVARTVYRQPPVEVFLLFCVLFQVSSGLFLVVRGWKQRRGLVAWLQAATGAYIAFFLLVHVGAVLYGRAVLNLDTNFYFAAAGFHVPPYQFFFGPYYFFAVLAFFTHLGCAAYWRVKAQPRLERFLVIALPASVGGVLSLLIVLCLAGVLQPVEIPPEYKATYASPAT
jgi:succinate dehydrogenase/fumarate reductase cytochrome b subunit